MRVHATRRDATQARRAGTSSSGKRTMWHCSVPQTILRSRRRRPSDRIESGCAHFFISRCSPYCHTLTVRSAEHVTRKPVSGTMSSCSTGSLCARIVCSSCTRARRGASGRRRGPGAQLRGAGAQPREASCAHAARTVFATVSHTRTVQSTEPESKKLPSSASAVTESVCPSSVATIS